jgi:hypothetical protein
MARFIGLKSGAFPGDTSNLVGADTVVDILAAAAGKRQDQELAAELGITKQELSDIMTGRRAPSKRVLAAMDIEPEKRYRIKPKGRAAGVLRELEKEKSK